MDKRAKKALRMPFRPSLLLPYLLIQPCSCGLAARRSRARARWQVAAGELQLVVPEGAGPLARQVLSATLPPRWTLALRQAFAEVRRQFDPTGILLGGR